MLNKTTVIKRLRAGESIKIISPKSHKYFDIIRKPEKIQTNAVKFERWFWLYFDGLKAGVENYTNNGFVLPDYFDGDKPIVYEFVQGM